VVICVILGIIIGCLLIYVAYLTDLIKIPFLDKANTNMQTEETVDDTTIVKTQTQTFIGEAVTATLPKGWSIQEYFNGEGSDMLTEGVTYTGLTGLKIFNVVRRRCSG
jgi:hypothetical protein